MTAPTLEDAKQYLQALPIGDLQRLKTWIILERVPELEAKPQVDKALAEETQKLWEAHPELKPGFDTEPVEVAPAGGKTVTLDDLLAKYQPWVQPTGAHDALPTEAIVTDEGRIWRTDLPALNVWKPGTMNAGWTDITDELLAAANPKLAPEPESEGETTPDDTPATPTVPEWKPNLNVKPGERYRFQGDTYEVIQGHTSAGHWPPNAVPALYKKV